MAAFLPTRCHKTCSGAQLSVGLETGMHERVCRKHTQPTRHANRPAHTLLQQYVHDACCACCAHSAACSCRCFQGLHWVGAAAVCCLRLLLWLVLLAFCCCCVCLFKGFELLLGLLLSKVLVSIRPHRLVTAGRHESKAGAGCGSTQLVRGNPANGCSAALLPASLMCLCPTVCQPYSLLCCAVVCFCMQAAGHPPPALVPSLDLHRLCIVDPQHAPVNLRVVHVVYGCCCVVLLLKLNKPKPCVQHEETRGQGQSMSDAAAATLAPLVSGAWAAAGWLARQA